MKLSQLLQRESIVTDLSSTTKRGIIRELARAVAPVAGIDAEEIAAVLMERESLGSTGIGGGIAILTENSMPSKKSFWGSDVAEPA